MYNTIVPSGNALRFVYVHLDHNTSVVGASIFWYRDIGTETRRTKVSIFLLRHQVQKSFSSPVVSRNSFYCIASNFCVLVFHSSALKMSRDEVKHAPESFIERSCTYILKCVQWYTNYSFHLAALYLIPAVSILHNF